MAQGNTKKTKLNAVVAEDEDNVDSNSPRKIVEITNPNKKFSLMPAKELFEDWEENGRVTFLKLCKDAFVKQSPDEEQNSIICDEDSELMLASLFFKLVNKGLDGLISKAQILGLIKELVNEVPQALSFLADAFATVDEITIGSICKTRQEFSSERREIFKDLVLACKPNLHYLFLERFNRDHLLELKIIESKEKFNASFRRNLQSIVIPPLPKYNLLRESSEGYAKVISIINGESSQLSIEKMFLRLCDLIGLFKLDSKKVVDLIFEAMEVSTSPSYYVPIFKNFNLNPLVIRDIYQMKFNMMKGRQERIFLPIALLIKEGYITLDQFSSWLSPSREEIVQRWEKRIEKAKLVAKRSMIVTINNDKISNSTNLSHDPNDFLICTTQKHEFCGALIELGEWEMASHVLDQFPPFALMSNYYVSSKLIAYINFLIWPLYKKLYKTNFNEECSHYPYVVGKHAQIHSFEELESSLDKFFKLGPYIYTSSGLFSRVIRTLKAYLTDTRNKENTKFYWEVITILDEVLLPGLSLMDSPQSHSEELWGILRLFPYSTRFSLYTSWKDDESALAHPILLEKKVEAIKKVKGMMKRLAKGSDISKFKTIEEITHAMPGVVLDYILSQIQLYDNLIQPVADSLKGLTVLSFDVLGHSMLDALSPSIDSSSPLMLLPSRPKMKHDGMTVAQWIQNIGEFASIVYKKFNISLHPIFQYIANQLKAKVSLDLVVLTKILKSMSGVEVFENFNAEQLKALGGGDLLYDIVKLKTDKDIQSKKRSSLILVDALCKNGLLVALPLLIATQKDGIIFDKTFEVSHMKLISSLYDQCQEALIQFGTFLSKCLTLEEQSTQFPSISELILEYHAPIEVSIFLWRPFFTKLIENKLRELRKAKFGRMPFESPALAIAQSHNWYVEASRAIFAPIVEIVRTTMVPRVFEEMTCEFYVLFWSLTLTDIYVPTEMYGKEVQKIKRASRAAAENKDFGTNKRKQEGEKFNLMIVNLVGEEDRRKEHVERVMYKLRMEKDTWFKEKYKEGGNSLIKSETMVLTLLQKCIFPRILFHAEDAVFTAHFLYLLHRMKTPNFPTLLILDKVLCDLNQTIICCTESEAHRFGRFLCILLEITLKWHQSKSAYDHECYNAPGFKAKFKQNPEREFMEKSLDFESYRHVCHKWQYRMTKSLIALLETEYYVSIRNTFIILMRILPAFPKIDYLASALKKWVEKVRMDSKNTRPDLFHLATGYLGKLVEIWPTIVEEKDFHQVLKPTQSVNTLQR